jgi:hypothetical protein
MIGDSSVCNIFWRHIRYFIWSLLNSIQQIIPHKPDYLYMRHLKLLLHCSWGLCYFWCYMAHVFSSLLAFQDNTLVPSSGVKQSRPTMECYTIFLSQE